VQRRAPALAVAAALIVAGAAQSGTPLRGQIVFDDYLLGAEVYHLFRERPDGTGRVRLTRGPGNYIRAHWSPDGQRLVAEGGPGLVILDRDGRTLRRIDVGDVNDARWSPTGTLIAYLLLRCQDPLGRGDAECADLWVMRPDGSGRHRLSASGVDLLQGLGSLYSWSPDGRRIVYVSRRGLSVVNVTSGSTRLIWSHAKLIALYPGWSPDGRWILFAKQRAPAQVSDVALIAPDGRRLHVLPHTAGVLEPHWSPDGRHIAYLIDVPNGGGWIAAVARADGSGRIKLGPSGDYQGLVWSPDSTHVLYIGPGNTFEIARADGRGSPLRIPGGEDPDWGI
jgi:Tol biopolymer transport system component